MDRQKESWTHVLTAAEAAELADVATDLDRRGLDLMEIKPGTAPLPELSPVLRRIRHDILFGRGFALLRGLPIDRLSYRQAAFAFWVVGMCLGDEASAMSATSGSIMRNPRRAAIKRRRACRITATRGTSSGFCR